MDFVSLFLLRRSNARSNVPSCSSTSISRAMSMKRLCCSGLSAFADCFCGIPQHTIIALSDEVPLLAGLLPRPTAQADVPRNNCRATHRHPERLSRSIDQFRALDPRQRCSQLPNFLGRTDRFGCFCRKLCEIQATSRKKWCRNHRSRPVHKPEPIRPAPRKAR